MALGELNASPLFQALKSPCYELDAQPLARSIAIETMEQLKQWVGCFPRWLSTVEAYGETPPGSYPWNPPVAWRRNFRKKVAQLAVNWSQNLDSQTYSGVHSISSPGQAPVIAGQPFGIRDDDTGPYPYHPLLWGDAPADWWHLLATTWNDTVGWGIEGFSGDWTTASLGPLQVYGEELGTTQSVGLTLSGAERPVSDQCAIAKARLLARSSWDYGIEGFSEYLTAPGPWTGDPIPINWNSLFYLNGGWFYPFFGARTLFENQAWTGWLYETTEEIYATSVDLGPAGIGGGFINGIRCNRARFKTSPASHYFIASAFITKPPWLWAMQSGDPLQALTEVHIESEGDTTADVPVEIPWPARGATDFVETNLPDSGPATLSYGSMCFAILGETPAAWSARTGIPYS
jgi:hypothetical protein